MKQAAASGCSLRRAKRAPRHFCGTSEFAAAVRPSVFARWNSGGGLLHDAVNRIQHPQFKSARPKLFARIGRREDSNDTPPGKVPSSQPVKVDDASGSR